MIRCVSQCVLIISVFDIMAHWALGNFISTPSTNWCSTGLSAQTTFTPSLYQVMSTLMSTSVILTQMNNSLVPLFAGIFQSQLFKMFYHFNCLTPHYNFRWCNKIIVRGEKMEVVKYFKYLGMIIDNILLTVDFLKTKNCRESTI